MTFGSGELTAGTGDERDLVAALNQRFAEPVHDSFGSTVLRGRNRRVMVEDDMQGKRFQSNAFLLILRGHGEHVGLAHKRILPMIARYTRPEMARIWDDRRRYQIWLQVELAVCAEMAREKIIPQGDWKKLQKACNALFKRGGVDPKRVDHHEAVTRHDVIAFTTAVAEEIGPISRYIHFGLTSSDVVDTSSVSDDLRGRRVLLADIDRLLKTLKAQAKRFQKLATIGQIARNFRGARLRSD